MNMNNLKYLIAIVLVMTTPLGCYNLRHKFERIQPQYVLSTQLYFDDQQNKGESRIIFFNGSNIMTHGLDMTDKIDIVINDKNVGSIRRGEYIGLNLLPGKLQVNLTHYDFFKFTDDYVLDVQEGLTYIEVYNGISSTKYRIVKELPDAFYERYVNPYM